MKARYQLVVAAMVVALMVTSFLAGRQYHAVAASPDTARELVRLVSGLSAGGNASGTGAARIEDVSLRPLETFQEVLTHLRRHYLSPIKNETKLTYFAIQGALGSLREPPYKDRYSRFMDAEAYRSFLDENEGHFGGIGAEIGVREMPSETGSGAPCEVRCPVCGTEISKAYQIIVVAPLPDGPAEHAGLEAGDHILKVDGTPTAGLGFAEAVRRMKGRPGTTVTLLVEGKADGKPREVKITRAVIQVRSVRSEMLADRIGYLRISTFNETTPDLAKKALRDLLAEGMRGLVLDLRGNTGGELDSCVETASEFIGEGPVVYIEERGQPRKVRNAVNHGKRIALPLVVLINGGSASAAEILAGAIQDNKLGTLMGVKTFGKGLVQTVFPLQDGSALALTTARYLTPSLRDIEHKGIAPDVVVEQPESNEPIRPLSEKDTQAARALRYLRDQLNQRLPVAA